MEENFDQNDFEDFLRNQLKNHRMYADDSVWREINKTIHGEKKWTSLTIAAFIILSITIAICVYFTPKPNIFITNPITQSKSNFNSSHTNNTISNNVKTSGTFDKDKHYIPVPPTQYANNSAKSISEIVIESNSELEQQNTPNPSSITIIGDRSINTRNSDSEYTNDGEVHEASIIHLYNEPSGSLNSKDRSLNSSEQKVNEQEVASLLKSNDAFKETNYTRSLNNLSRDVTGQTELADKNNIITPDSIISINIPSNLSVPTLNEAESVFRSNSTEVANETDDRKSFDYLLEKGKPNIANVIRTNRGSEKRRFSYQVYFAPSISYRNLFEDRLITKTSSNIPLGLNFVTDVNSVVRHKPGTGIETGVSFRYHLTNKIRIKAGLQFNMRQYNIEAYRANTEMASIALVGRNGYDTVSSLAMYRSRNGSYSEELANRYFQISTPMGLEWEIVGTKFIQLNVAGSIQPTYLLNRNAYVLSSNFKNYTENPGIIRSWNINTNIETFISFKAGDFKWQIGPQLRFQPYSTFISKYPIKENLLDYGLKIGFSKSL